MSRLWAKVILKSQKNAEFLIKAFFREFNPESSIVVHGQEAKMEIVFDNPPMEIIGAIGHCEVLELNYGEVPEEYEESSKEKGKTEEQEKIAAASKEEDKELEKKEKKTRAKKQPATKKKTSTSKKQKKGEEKSTNLVEEAPKKRRGRPPKAKTVAEETAKMEEEAPKKRRGRPPKAKTVVEGTGSEASHQEEEAPKKKKGRPKTKTTVAEETAKMEEEAPKKKRGRTKKESVIAEESNSGKEEKAQEIEQVSKILPELNEIASKASSFEEFATAVASWLDMGVREEFFKNLLTIANEVKTTSWNELEAELKARKIKYTNWDKIITGRKVSEKLKYRSITIINFLKETKLYKDYCWTEKGKKLVKKEKAESKAEEQPATKNEETSLESKEPVSKVENALEEKAYTTTREENQDKEKETVSVVEKEEPANEKEISFETSDKPRIRLSCMPEAKEFEEALASLDKAQAIEKRVAYVLENMGLNEAFNKADQEKMIKLATIAIKNDNLTSFDIVFAEADIAMEEAMQTRMKLSKLVNSFAAKYENGGKNQKVKLITFFAELQKVVLFDSEVEKNKYNN